MQLTAEQRHKKIQIITVLGAIVDGILGVIKVGFGWMTHSPALVADGFHSFSDLLTDVGVVLFSGWAKQAPDEDHPYGHRRFETLGTVILGTTLIVVATAIAWDSLRAFFYPTYLPQPSVAALVVTVVSIISKEWIFRVTFAASKRLKSKLLEANAWHSRSDAYSSVVVLLGVGATWLGFPWVELVAAIVVALMIGKMGVELTWNASQDLMDRAIPPEEIEKICQMIEGVPGVIHAHELRSRMMGSEVYIDVHIQVAPFISVSEGHYIADQVSVAVKNGFDAVTDVIVHVDTEEDNDSKEPKVMFPNRKMIVEALKAHSMQPQSVKIHYHQNGVYLDLMFDSSAPLPSHLDVNLKKFSKAEPWVKNLSVFINRT